MRAYIPHGRRVAIAATLVLWGCGGDGYGGGGGTEPPTTGAVTGQVTVDGSPRAGARARLQALGATTDARPAQTTNATGSYTFTLVPPGEYRVFVDLADTLAADPGPAEDSVTVVAGATAPAATFRLRLLVGGVTGVVIDDVGAALGGRSVFLRRQGSVSERSATTGGDGSYSFASVAVGTYIVRVATVCGEPAARTATVAVDDGVQAEADTIKVTPRTSEFLLSCEVQPIFTNHCASCHGGASPQEGLDLSSPSRVKATAIDVPSRDHPTIDRIEPFEDDSASSYLVCKIIPTCGLRLGLRMPWGCTGAACLSAARIDTIRLWIRQGGQDVP